MKRRPLQGLVTVIRFNWHFFVSALAIIALLPTSCWLVAPEFLPMALTLAMAVLLGVAVSMAATAYAYDLSGLYHLCWLDPWVRDAVEAANIHSGFDETTGLLRERYPEVRWHVLDFYDPAKHTEVSIRRARSVCIADPETRSVSTSRIPLDDRTLDCIILMLAAHEIRSLEERITFFRELGHILTDDGTIIVTEHLRDLPNLVAYTMGAWHFHPRSEWLTTFQEAGLKVVGEMKNNRLITTFILRKHGSAS